MMMGLEVTDFKKIVVRAKWNMHNNYNNLQKWFQIDNTDNNKNT